MTGAVFYVKGEKGRDVKGADGREIKGKGEKDEKREGEREEGEEGVIVVERRKEKKTYIQLCPLRRLQGRSATGARGLFLHH